MFFVATHAQAQLPTGSGLIHPGSNIVPPELQSGQRGEERRKELENSRLILPGVKPGRPAEEPAAGEDSSTETSEEAPSDGGKSESPPPPGSKPAIQGAGASGGGDGVPRIEESRVGAGKKNATFYQERNKTELLPRFTQVPPAEIPVLPGTPLRLTVALRANPRPDTEQLVAWIVDGRVLCEGLTCALNLKPEQLSSETKVLQILAYGHWGSASSFHTLKRAATTPGKTAAVAFTGEAPSMNPGKLAAFTLRGNALVSVPNGFLGLGPVARNLEWSGNIRTLNLGILRIQGPALPRWTILPRTDAALISEEAGRGAAEVLSLTRGGVRVTYGILGQAAPARETRYEVRTPEARVFLPFHADAVVQRTRPGAKALERRSKRPKGEAIPAAEQVATRIILLRGSAEIAALGANAAKEVVKNLPIGVELVILEDGTMLPLSRPTAARMERITKLTLSYEDELERKRFLKANAVEDIKAHLRTLEELAKDEDFFELLNAALRAEPYASEEPLVSYYIGVGHRGVYQIAEAEKHLNVAFKRMPADPRPSWQLGQIRMEEKRWAEASAYFEQASSKMDSGHPLYPEYCYYAGVARFEQGQFFSARTLFRRSLWEQSLDDSLKLSAGSFLQEIGKKRVWNVLIPFGVQYDGNPLGLSSADAVPPGVSPGAAVRPLAGLIFNYDTSVLAEKDGWYPGFGAKVLQTLHFPRSFSLLDATLMDATFSYTKKTLGEKPDQLKIDGVVGGLMIDRKFSSLSFGSALSWRVLDLAATFDWNLGEKDPALRANSFSLREDFKLELMKAAGAWTPDLLLGASQRFPGKVTAAAGRVFGVSATPRLNGRLGPRFSVATQVPLSFELDTGAAKKKTMRAGVGATGTYFITPEFIASPGVTFEYFRKSSPAGAGLKPGASLLFTALL